jgi:diguanylate cyclase (GGDEF)-like protein
MSIDDAGRRAIVPAARAEGEERSHTTVASYALIALYDVPRGDLFRQVLGGFCVPVVVTRDGEEARATLALRGAPLILVTETSLPLVDGFTLIEELRFLAPATEAPALLVATSDDLRVMSESLRDRLGISDVLPLPLSADQARVALRRAFDLLARTNPNTPTPAPPPPARYGLAHAGLFEPMVQKLVARTAQTFRVPMAFLFWDDGAHRWFEAHLEMDPSATTENGPIDWTFVEQTLQSGEPLVVPDATRHPLFESHALVRQGLLRGYAAAPIVDGTGKVTGALGLVDLKPLSLGAREIDGLVALARHVGRGLTSPACPTADPITNGADPANPLTDLARLALVDPLTGLVNRLGGERSIARELARARRLRSRLCFAMFDVDHFKQVNDRFGHQTGDRVLRLVGTTLRHTLRGSDVAVRWGGDEFLAVLPETNGQGAWISAERVRQAVGAAAVEGVGPVTVSAGIAEMGPGEAVTAAIARADLNLYEGKARGRDRVVGEGEI